jgi:hypothetical protein
MPIYRVPVKLSWPRAGSPGVNVWHVRTVENNPGSELQTAVDALRAFYNSVNLIDLTSSAGIFAPGTTVTLGDIVDVDSQEFATATWATVTAQTTPAAAAPALQLVVGWRTSSATRRGRGRTFLGPLQAAAVDTDGTPKAAVLSGVGAAAQTLVDASLGIANWAVGVYGLMEQAPAGTTDYTGLPRVLRDVTGYKVKDQFAVLRSRRD